MSWSLGRGASFGPPPRPSPLSRHRGLLPPVVPQRTRGSHAQIEDLCCRQQSLASGTPVAAWIMVKWWHPVARLVPAVENDDDTGGHENSTWYTTEPEHAQQRRRCPRLWLRQARVLSLGFCSNQEKEMGSKTPPRKTRNLKQHGIIALPSSFTGASLTE
ncbi:unnamed protein product [Ectocarpus sp. 6 AP-2014]